MDAATQGARLHVLHLRHGPAHDKGAPTIITTVFVKWHIRLNPHKGYAAAQKSPLSILSIPQSPRMVKAAMRSQSAATMASS